MTGIGNVRPLYFLIRCWFLVSLALPAKMVTFCQASEMQTTFLLLLFSVWALLFPAYEGNWQVTVHVIALQ